VLQQESEVQTQVEQEKSQANTAVQTSTSLPFDVNTVLAKRAAVDEQKASVVNLTSGAGLQQQPCQNNTTLPFDVNKVLARRAAGDTNEASVVQPTQTKTAFPFNLRINPLSVAQRFNMVPTTGATTTFGFTRVGLPAALSMDAIVPVKVLVPDHANSSTLSSLSKITAAPAEVCIPIRPTLPRGHMPIMSHANEMLNLSMTGISDENKTSIIKTCMKAYIFRKCKFYNRDRHGVFSTKSSSMCGQVIQHCHIAGADGLWWHQMRRVVVKTHTDHRNNCIKAMQTRFKSMFGIATSMCCHHAVVYTNNVYVACSRSVQTTWEPAHVYNHERQS
jgi:hypothetical protein